MTPAAATVAGRATEPPARSYARTAGGLADPPRTAARTTERTHRRPLRPTTPSPRRPRRVSGPAAGAVALPGRVTAPAKPAPRRAPSRPRTKTPPASSRPLAARIAAYIQALPDHRLLDRLVRGRAWIPLLGVLLVGIVAIQVEVLKLGTSIGRSLNLATQLQSRNELLRASVSGLSDDQRIMRSAARLGMVMPGPTETSFIPAHRNRALAKAIAGIRAPNAQAFLAALAMQESHDGVANPTLGSTGSPIPPNSPAAAAAAASSGTTATATGTAATTTASTTTVAGATSTVAGTTSTVAPTGVTVVPTTSSTGGTPAG